MKRLGGYELKKSITVGLASLLAFSLSACGGENVESSTLEESSIVVSSTGEYATSEAVENGSDGGYEVEVPDLGTDNMNETYTLDMLTEEQLSIFKDTIVGAADLINGGLMTVEDMDVEQNYLIEAYVAGGVLPENGIELFTEWKEVTGYYEQFSGSTSGTSGTTGTVENGGSTGDTTETGGSTAGNSSESTEEVIEVVPPTNTNKPDPSEGQKAEQDEANGEEEGWVTWENKEEVEQKIDDMAGEDGKEHGFIDLDPDVEW